MPNDPLAAKPPTAGVAKPRQTNAQREAAYYIDTMKLTPAQAAGILGNNQVESNFNPSAYNPQENAIGISQWELGRRTALQEFARAHGGKETDLGIQLGFLQHEANGPYNYALQDLKNVKGNTAADAQRAAGIWDAEYEHSSGSSTQQREIDAASLFEHLQSGGSLTGGTAPGVGTGGTNIGGDTATIAPPSILDQISGAGIDIYNGAAKVASIITSWEKALEVIGSFFGALLWIFNVDHFLKFLLYIFGTLAILTGLGLVTFGAGKREESAA